MLVLSNNAVYLQKENITSKTALKEGEFFNATFIVLFAKLINISGSLRLHKAA